MFEERMTFIKRLARDAGALTLEGFGHSRQIPKGNPDYYDIVTEYDVRTEGLIKGRIQHEFGEPVLGEEGGLVGDPDVARHKLWIIDPIDGTFNYQRGLPLYAISIAYCEEGVPVCGVVLMPATDQLYFAAQGTGAFVVEGHSPAVPIHVSREREIARLTISLAGKDAYRLLAACEREEIPWRSLRMFVGAVPSLAYVASGHLDVLVDTSLNLWDCAAGDVILREAGGPALVDNFGVPIFPEFVNRRLDSGAAERLVCLGTSGADLLEEPLARVLTAAGFEVKLSVHS